MSVLPLPSTNTLAPEGSTAGTRGAGPGSQQRSRHKPWQPHLQSETQSAFDALPPWAPVMIAPARSNATPCLSHLCPSQLSSPLGHGRQQPSSQCGAASWSKGSELALSWSWGTCQNWCRKPGNVPCSFSLPSLPFFPQSKQSHARSSWRESRLPISFLAVPLALQPANRTTRPSLRPQGRGAQCVPPPAHSQGKVSACVISILLWVPSQGHRLQPDCFSSLPTWFHVDLQECFCQSPVSF